MRICWRRWRLAGRRRRELLPTSEYLPFYLLPAVPLLLLTTIFGMGVTSPRPYVLVNAASVVLGIVYLLFFNRMRRRSRTLLVGVHLLIWVPMLMLSALGDIHRVVYWGLGVPLCAGCDLVPAAAAVLATVFADRYLADHGCVSVVGGVFSGLSGGPGARIPGWDCGADLESAEVLCRHWHAACAAGGGDTAAARRGHARCLDRPAQPAFV